MYQELEILYFKYILKIHQTFILICKIHQSFKLSVYNFGRVLQPAESAFLADSALLSNAPANHTHEYRHHCLYSHVSKNVVQPSDICVQTLASPHCSHHCSRCSSVCRKISVAQLAKKLMHIHKSLLELTQYARASKAFCFM